MDSSVQLDGLRVVLVATRNPLNIGAVARAMSNFGATQLRLVKPYEKAFREARSAVGATDLLASAREYENVTEAIADCSLVVGTTAARRRELHHAAHRVEAGAALLREHLASGAAALLFGSERYGLSTSDLSYCHWTMSIATPGDNPSLNLGQAVAVCLHELVREGVDQLDDPAAEAPSNREMASAGEVERLTDVLFSVLRETRYWHPGSGATTEEKVRRLVRRLHLSGEDAEVMLGMCRQILWRIRKGDSKV